MRNKEFEAFVREAEKSIKTVKGLGDFSQLPTKITAKMALNVEQDDHLGYDKHQPSSSDNSRSGNSSKTLITEGSSIEVEIPRNRTATSSLSRASCISSASS